MAHTGRIETIIGAMGGGKSEELLRRMNTHVYAGRKCVILKHASDVRFDAGQSFQTRNGSTTKIKTYVSNRVGSLEEEGYDFDVLGIDEGQFFDDIVKIADDLANRGKIIIVAMLNANHQRGPWPATSGLIAISEKVKKLVAVCGDGCNASASNSWKLTDSPEVEAVGGDELYKAVCRSCYQKLLKGRLEREKALPSPPPSPPSPSPPSFDSP